MGSCPFPLSQATLWLRLLMTQEAVCGQERFLDLSVFGFVGALGSWRGAKRRGRRGWEGIRDPWGEKQASIHFFPHLPYMLGTFLHDIHGRSLPPSFGTSAGPRGSQARDPAYHSARSAPSSACACGSIHQL